MYLSHQAFLAIVMLLVQELNRKQYSLITDGSAFPPFEFEFNYEPLKFKLLQKEYIHLKSIALSKKKSNTPTPPPPPTIAAHLGEKVQKLRFLASPSSA